MENQKKLIFRMKNKADSEKLSINSQMYFIADKAAVCTVSDLARQKSSLTMAWMEEETLKTKVLYEPQSLVTINKAIIKREKEAMLFMLSDGVIVIVSSKEPTGCTPQVVTPRAKESKG
ncbi:MAG: hypothetical protein M1510_09315 [Nitrospirae bacterium]|nr:hypothetical protein [Nitrospirota bacterium]